MGCELKIDPVSSMPVRHWSLWRILALMLCDSGWAFLCAFAVLWLYKAFGAGAYSLSQYAGLLPFCGVLIFCNALFRCYHGSILYPGAGLNKIEEIRRLVGASAITYLLLFALLAFTRNTAAYSRFCLFISMCLTCVSLPVMRALLRRLLKAADLGQTDILIVSHRGSGTKIAREFQSDSYYGFRVVGFIDDSPAEQGKIISGIPVLGPLSAVREIAGTHNIDYIVCCLSMPAFARAYKELSLCFKNIMFVPAGQIFPVAWLTPLSIGIYSGFEIRNKLLQPLPRLLKAGVEILLAAAAILFLLPLFLVLVLLIKLTSPGPVFYRAERLGQHGKKISVWKFRTMYADADKRLAELLAGDPELRAEWEKEFKLRNDPRITPAGGFLRKTSLDELPQFWNVLTGEMSIIGPRPIVEDEIRYYGEYYDLRKRVKPGITGLWQVSGRNDTDYAFRVLLDTYYIMNWSVWMDYYIFFKTVYVVLMRKGAR